MLKETLRKLGPEFGVLNEDSDQVVQDVMNKLDRSAKLDEVDTVTFGLETDDGKIVKVYVKVDQAEDFEKALSDKLGEIDDIEEVFNLLSKDYEIIDVEWPVEETGGDEEELDDGSDVLDPRVHNNAKINAEIEDKLKISTEHLTFGEIATMKILDESALDTIEGRFTTSTQLLIYHAILELGIPEIALARNPYRAAIIKGIKDKAFEINANAAVKNSLKVFINRSIDFEDRALNNRQLAKNEKLNDSIESSKDQEILNEAAVQVFWATFVKLINYLASNPEMAKKFLESPIIKQMMARSSAAIVSKLSAALQAKMKDVVTAIESDPKNESLNEAVKPDEIVKLIKDMLTIADPDGKNADAALNSSQWTSLFNSFKTKLSQKFSSTARSKLNTLQRLLPEVKKEGDIKLDGKLNVPVGGNNGRMSGKLNENQAVDWEFGMDGDSTIIQCQSIKVKLDVEEVEKLIKGVSNRDVVIVRDEEDPTHKIVFSPRGTSIMVKKVGTSESVMMKQKDIDSMLSFISQGKEPEDETPEDEKDDIKKEGARDPEIIDAAKAVGTVAELTDAVYSRVEELMSELRKIGDGELTSKLSQAKGSEKFAIRVALKAIGRRMI